MHASPHQFSQDVNVIRISVILIRSMPTSPECAQVYSSPLEVVLTVKHASD